MKAYIVWALPEGTRNPIDEMFLAEVKTQEQVEKIKKLATEQGFHSFRITDFSMSTPPNFAAAVQVDVQETQAQLPDIQGTHSIGSCEGEFCPKCNP
jgi:hypothetical protein